MTFLSFSFIFLIISLSLSLRGTAPSTIKRIRSADSIFSFALSTPIFSTISSVFLIPAVSISLSVTPFRFAYSSRVSLVVPSILVTIALSSPKSILSTEDLPALGLPMIAVLIPSFISRPSSEVLRRFSISDKVPSNSLSNLSGNPSRL